MAAKKIYFSIDLENNITTFRRDGSEYLSTFEELYNFFLPLVAM